jgi:hypothetical protein
MAEMLVYYGYSDLDISVVRGDDRRVTRWISQWARDCDLPFAGVRYLSRLEDAWECWAVFDHVKLVEVERRPILVNDETLAAVAKRFGLRVF